MPPPESSLLGWILGDAAAEAVDANDEADGSVPPPSSFFQWSFERNLDYVLVFIDAGVATEAEEVDANYGLDRSMPSPDGFRVPRQPSHHRFVSSSLSKQQIGSRILD